MRNGAQAGDQLWVSGTLGDAAIGLDLVGGVLGIERPRYGLPRWVD